ncbi:phospho-N-acetylmuramoyl-pentapeptide-transferase [Chlamydia pneumoniae TW-183]|uniref:Phospho-N-acetylmuramoyl-pentapeptide-transferase n=2 Tax=Chlamydia pneumoniae TaxID=83558 RepID=A0A0F7XDG2_CHLPN|nr:phospho-N-acetylmuramoyl-pentapeptide-transferase [Chlamydia pneumoniae]AAD19038.1 Muramoyl-Pentapeptide Transferase [Chlamydia pneumoniae CWL029]AAP98861.1 phospho-N-acetylmuramoyl-pentapeptide-transferase [Chlamydia pneumoniae TW-183]ACZ32789.1 phospho-N-acetylmuramoyl-pentapeptide-transferase [Chlamydia pneumoniae LPCoLN]CRI33431.1 Phospho-N-acetylmuramoyl-pentapeptide-transferase [Chlamydia pneumoniae]CRI37421.1 Phospho-N-acetylmuramoyl-pentapeptide-transferase [Chlamydia pneumoniae]
MIPLIPMFLKQSLFFSLALTGMTTLVLTVALGVPVMKWLKRKNYRDYIHKEYCEKLEMLHKDKAEVPTGGGVLLFISLIASLLVWLPWGKFSTWFFIILLTCYAGLGWYDDRIKIKRKQGHGLKAKHKFMVQIAIAAFTLIALPYIYGSTEPLWTLKIPFMEGMLSLPFWLGKVFCLGLALVAIIGTSNAVNLTDGLDGLAAGTMSFAALGFIFVALRSSTIPIAQDVAYVLAALVGACIGFLWYNGFPAQLFMGDTGSLLLGGLLGSCAVMLRAECILVVIGGVFVAEAGSVILQVLSCRLRKKRLFLCSPLHHHYEYQGLPETKIVMRFWIFSFVCAGLGIAAVLWR